RLAPGQVISARATWSPAQAVVITSLELRHAACWSASMAARSHEARIVSLSALRASPSADALRASLRHVRPVRPVKFPSAEPEDEHLGQSRRHLNLCRALSEILRAAIGHEHTMGADQFVYFDAARP